MLIVSTHIPKQHMHKKENMPFLVIPSQSSVLQSHQIQKRNLRRQTSTSTKLSDANPYLSYSLWRKFWTRVDSVLVHHFSFMRRKWQPTPVFLTGESHERRSLVGYSPRAAQSRTRLRDFTFTFSFIAQLTSVWMTTTFSIWLSIQMKNKFCLLSFFWILSSIYWFFSSFSE